MGKRTSDFMALAAIFGGVGLGLGLTSLYAQSRADDAPHTDDSSVRVHVLRRSIVVAPAGAHVVRHALIVEPGRIRVDVDPEVIGSFRLRTWTGKGLIDRKQLGTLRAEVEDLRFETKEIVELEEILSDALEEYEVRVEVEVEGRDADDERRRRRRRRPR